MSGSATSSAAPAAPWSTVRWLVGAFAGLFSLLGLLRFATVHNHTFDLAFYTRMTWGLLHLDFWEPLVNAHFYGLHLCPILVPLGILGLPFGIAPALLVAQGVALALAAVPLARLGEARLGPRGALLGAAAFLFYPNLAHVAGYELHPGTLAVLPLAWAAWAIERRAARAFVVAVVGVLLSREDLALMTGGLGLLWAIRHRSAWRVGLVVALASAAYLALFLLVLHPRFAPATGSLELHFGRFGDGPVEVLLYLVGHPLDLVRHLGTPARLTYLPKVLAPLLLLPLLRPSWLLPTVPVLAINLLSDWSTTTDLDVHYLTPAVPFFVAGALSALEGRPPFLRWGLAAAVAVAHVAAGGTPLALDFAHDRFRPTPQTRDARRALAAVGPAESVQAPDALLAHVAERPVLRRGPPPEMGTDVVILGVGHRHRFRADEDLLRTVEEPTPRAWLARDDHALRLGTPRYLVLERGRPPRDGLGGRAIVGRADPAEGVRLAACLRLLGAELDGALLALDLVATGPCDPDLALRIGTGRRPRRVDLLFGGWLSPVHLRRGDRVRSRHRLTPAEVDLAEGGRLRVGLLRSSGARPEHADPMSVPLPRPRRARAAP
ncbi:MAG: DUF2079 domain-containing protein [Sandaracinaceae bacterium]